MENFQGGRGTMRNAKRMENSQDLHVKCDENIDKILTI